MANPFVKRVNFMHTGHIGDIIAFLPLYQALKGTHLIIRDETWMAPMSGFKYNSLKPLLESQGINVSFNEIVGSLNYDLSGWRECYRDDISLMDAQARYLNLVDRYKGHFKITGPWLKVDKNPKTEGRVIFNRTPRYRNVKFPWDQVLSHFGNKSLFIGTKEEYGAFLNEVGSIDYLPTKSCLEVARAIEGADFFVGNQSSSFWIAAALHKPLLQEVYTIAPNSIVKYEGATYCFDGKLRL
jgi:hypothetical protein